MEDLDGVSGEVAAIFAAKEQRRRDLARLSFPEKVRTVMQLQEMAAVILGARGKFVKPWRMESVRVTSDELRVTSDE